MTLTVLSVAYPLAPVGPDAVGGAEQVLTQLDAALVRAGHRSLVVAAAGSEVAGTLLATPAPHGPIDEGVRYAMRLGHAETIRAALERWPVDLVHLHGVDAHHYLPPPGVPTLVTLHLPPSWYPTALLRPTRPDTWLNCVSTAQHRACPLDAALLPPIPNGVPVERLVRRVRRRGYALALGRICPEKGFHLALDAARLAGVPALLAGQVFDYETHRRYHEREIVPRLDRARRFVGPVGLRGKRRLLAGARCLLVPSLVPETSSLVAMEALAAGTPVVAFPAGALTEIVEPGRTGFLVDDEREMADAIHAADALDADACRAAALERCSAERMAARYLELYGRLARAAAA